jgi:alanine dehydrogenase
MLPVRILSDTDVKNILDIRNTVLCVEKAYILKAANQGKLFPLISEELSHGNADMDIKSGMLNGENVFGCKLVAWFGDNEKQGLPALTALTMLFDLKNGFPRAILNAKYLTAMRTGAAGAIGVKYLAKPDSEVLLVVGTGLQAVFQTAFTLSEVPTIKKVYVFHPLRYESAVRFQRSIKAEIVKIPNNINAANDNWIRRIESVEFAAIDNPVKALAEVDAVITVTPSRKASILKEWVRPGTHFSCIGADASGKQEIDEQLFDKAVVFVDDVTQASTVGEAQTAVRKGIMNRNQFIEIGQLIQGNATGRITGKDITIFDSTGIALQDLSVANYLLSKAEAMNLGTIAEI